MMSMRVCIVHGENILEFGDAMEMVVVRGRP